ncbi:unnamed protein product [Owenia fusiformis]|uniref:Uncharacterized protein n=1 Tax=Owenia fusiformis TaxID=6347 RepID=A0A8S4NEJ1_OWEFU|nr:unnamed protein product [Owenia fusiformis]
MAFRKNGYCVGALIGYCALVIIPVVHLAVVYSYWSEKAYVDTEQCTCSCWDTIFKGSYETHFSGYKHIYINVTSNTLKIWMLTMLAVLCLYESIKYVVKLTYKGTIRITMLAAFVSSIYPHYYTWWSFLNYWNDEFYDQWNHQVFFSTTELASTIVTLLLLNTEDKHEIRYRILLLLIMINVGVIHILTAGTDQLFVNVVAGEWHQKTRDLGFLIGDIVSIAAAFLEIGFITRHRPLRECIKDEDAFISCLFIIFMWFLASRL